MKAVNLIPTDQRRATATGNRSGSAYVVVGLLAALLAMAAGYVLTANKVTERQNQAAAAEAEADRLEAEAARRGSFTNFAEIKQTRLTAVSSIAGSRFDWERMIRELARVMPEDSWLQSVDASDTGKVGGAGSSSSDATAVQPKAKLLGCTPEQSDVARMMVRMRQMHRVSDVELNESRTELGQSDQASFDNCGSNYQFDLTVSFQPTPPASEAPRGTSTVPASLGGGS